MDRYQKQHSRALRIPVEEFHKQLTSENQIVNKKYCSTLPSCLYEYIRKKPSELQSLHNSITITNICMLPRTLISFSEKENQILSFHKHHVYLTQLRKISQFSSFKESKGQLHHNPFQLIDAIEKRPSIYKTYINLLTEKRIENFYPM